MARRARGCVLNAESLDKTVMQVADEVCPRCKHIIGIKPYVLLIDLRRHTHRLAHVRCPRPPRIADAIACVGIGEASVAKGEC